MTTKTIEEQVEEFQRMSDPDIPFYNKLYGKDSYSEWLKNNEDKHLFSNEIYGEPMFDLDEERIADWLRKALTQAEERGRNEEREDIIAFNKEIGHTLVLPIETP